MLTSYARLAEAAEEERDALRGWGATCGLLQRLLSSLAWLRVTSVVTHGLAVRVRPGMVMEAKWSRVW